MTGVAAAGPRLLAGLALIPVNDGYLVDGGPSRQLLSGAVAQSLLPRLLPLLDGAHPVAEIAAELDEPAARIERVIALLHAQDLLDRAPQPVRSRPDPMRTYLRRRLPAGRGDLVYGRLAGARVVVLGPDRICGPLADLIGRGGVGAVTRRPDSDARTPVSLVIQVLEAPEGSADPGVPPANHGVPWLAVRHHAGAVHIGPLRNVADQVCPKCTEVRPVAQAWEPAGAALLGAANALVTAQALRFLGQGTTRLARRVIELTDPCVPCEERVVVPRPDCPSCGQAGVRLDGPALAEFGDEYGAEPPVRGWDPEPAPRAERSEPAPLKQYVNPAGVSTRAASGAGASVTWLLNRTVGEIRLRTGPGLDRWVPSAAPGATRAYVLGDLLGRGPGMYYYDAPANEFVAVPGPVPDFPGAATVSTATGFVVVLTGDASALDAAFGSAGCRALLQDGGLAVAQLASGAAALRWRARAGGDRTGELAAALELDPDREFITAVVELVTGSGDGGSPVTSGARRLSQRLRSLALAYRFDRRPVAAELVADLAVKALVESDAIWTDEDGPAPALRCVLYARRVDGLRPGLYAVTAGEPAQLLAAEPAAPIEAHLRDRALDPPAMLLFTGHLADTLARLGAPGYRRLLGQAATAAGLVRLAAAGSATTRTQPLATGLFAGFPAALVCASTAERDPALRVFYACALGHPAVDQEPGSAAVAW